MNDLESGQLRCVRCDDLPWKPSTFAAGVFVKDVAVTDGLEMQMVRFEPGARLPLHTHECPEFIYVLEGELILGGQHLGRGWASVASVGSVHSDVHSETGCVFVLVDRPLLALVSNTVQLCCPTFCFRATPTPNHSIKQTAPWRNNFSVFATTP